MRAAWREGYWAGLRDAYAKAGATPSAAKAAAARANGAKGGRPRKAEGRQ
jgi:hypothetical protein